MKKMKRLLGGLLLVMAIVSLTSCGEKLVIPDVENLDVNTTKTLLASKQLIPKVEYEFHNDYEYDMVIRTEPAIGSTVKPDDVVKIFVCKGPVYLDLKNSVGWLGNVNNINNFSWGDDGKEETKMFKNVYVQEGYLYIDIALKIKSNYSVSFYKSFGTASINDTFDKEVPIDVQYKSEQVDNTGKVWTDITMKIPLSDLGVQQPTEVNTTFDFVVNGTRQSFKAGFTLSWAK